MANQVMNDWVELSKRATEPLLRFNEIAVHAYEEVARQQLDIARDYLELGIKQASVVSTADTPDAMVAEQGKLAAEFGEKLAARAQDFVKIAADTQQAISGWAADMATKPKAKASKAAGAA